MKKDNIDKIDRIAIAMIILGTGFAILSALSKINMWAVGGLMLGIGLGKLTK